MANFSFNDYQNLVANASNSANSPKVGFFKLKNDGDEALVRIKCASVEDLDFASVHTIQAGGRWLKVSCLNPLGSYAADSCGLCGAQASGNALISKAAKKVYIKMLISYKDPTTGNFTAAEPVIWERPASFAKDIAALLKDYGNLENVVLKVTRNGAAGDMQTKYALNYVPVYDKPEFVPADFSAFANFNIARHSYYEKTADEINTYLTTGAFPEVARSGRPVTTTAMPGAPAAPRATAPVATTYAASTPAQTAPVQQPVVASQAPVYQTATPVQTAVATPTQTPVRATPAAQPAATADNSGRPARTFGGFSF